MMWEGFLVLSRVPLFFLLDSTSPVAGKLMANTKSVQAIKTVVFFLVLVVGTVTFVQRLSSAEPIDQATAKLVVKMVPRYHINRPRIDDSASKQLLKTYLEDLDPLHLYFLQSDIDQFSSHQTTLDDELKNGDVRFGYQVYEVFKRRVHAQCDIADQLIESEFDFTLDETKPADYTKLTWAKTQEELNERWRKMIKFELLLARLDEDSDLKKVKEDLHKRYRNVRRIVDQRNPLDQLETYLTALTKCFDPHSSYMSPESWEDFEIDLKLSLDGIGAALRADDGYTVVASIVPNGAADKDGRLKAGDKITGVGQVDPNTDQPGEIVDIYEMKLSDVVRMIRGERGTKVVLRVQPKDTTETKEYVITREKIELTSQEAKGEIIDAQERVGRPGKIGVIYLPSFYRDFAGASGGVADFKSAAIDIQKILDRFRREKVDAVIFDLRYNTGGSLSEAIEITGHFIDQGPVVQVRQSEVSTPQVLVDEVPGTRWNGPLVVVCNRMSASASEIFAAAIKDYQRGLIVGDTTTHGKGTVQNLLDVVPDRLFSFLGGGSDRGKLKLTIQQFYRVNGDSTQNRGVRSHIVLPSLLDYADMGESFLEHALPFHTIRAAVHAANAMVTPEIVSTLAKRSEERVKASEEFAKVYRAIKRYQERKKRKVVSLNEAVVRKEREQDELDNEEKDPEVAAVEEQVDRDKKEIFPKSAYNDELLNITLDYLQALKERKTVKR